MSVFLALLLGALGAWSGWGAYKRELEENRPGQPNKPGLPTIMVGRAIAGIFIGAVLGLSCFTVPAASVGVLYNPIAGGIQHNVVVTEGFHLVSPFTSRTIYSVQVQNYTMSHVQGEGNKQVIEDWILCQTNEGLGVYIDLTVLYKVDKTRAPELWANLGQSNDEIAKVFVRPIVREKLRMVVAQYSISDVYGGNRGSIQVEIDDLLRPIFELNGIQLNDVQLRDVTYAYDAFKNAITEKQAAQQDIQAERRRLEKATFERATKINDAQGDYNKMKVKAQALKENPDFVQFEMARTLAPRVKNIYMETPYGGVK